MKGKNIDNTMKPLPQEMHFYWLGTLGGIQKEYALQWLKTNPDYKLSLWYDNSALLAYELKRRIQHHVEREVGSDEGRLTQTTWRLQEQAHAAIAEQMAEGKSFDQAAADFMIKVLGAAPQDLEGVLQANFRSFEECVTMLKASVPGSDVRLVDYSTLRVSAGRTTSTHYLQEFGLRGNLAAAKDIASLEVMDHVGGLYIDLDLLPEVNDELFAHVSRGTPPVALDDFEFAKTQAILDELAQNSADLDHREELKRKGVYTDYLQRMRNEGYADVADALVNAVRNRGGRNVFKPLGEIKVVRDGMRILKMREGLVNGCLGAYPGSKALRLAKDKIVRNYEVPAQTNADFPKDEAAIKEATGKVMDKLLESGISKENAYFTARIAGYRLDGIQAKMQSQIYLAGSAVLKEALGDLYGANWHNDERFVFKPVNNYTEEEIKSSWRKS